MSKDMRRIERELSGVKNVIDHVYQIVRVTRYLDGIEKVDGAYQSALVAEVIKLSTYICITSKINEVVSNQQTIKHIFVQNVARYFTNTKLTRCK